VFLDKDGKSRIVKAYDFRNIRKIISLDNLNTRTEGFRNTLSEVRTHMRNPLSEKEVTKLLEDVAVDADNDRPINWGLVEKLIEINPESTPTGGHGTHVAGIIGANGGDKKQFADGMCPDIKLYDFRVIGNSIEDTEFAIIAALQFIRYLNERHDFISIHGANLSLSIPHDVRNFACGQTPVCNECQRLVDRGVVVVAAAGNFGYHNYETKEGYYEGYTAFSITDPGNTDGVITVGATHRYRPHTYGVSFFSSRGPTGDGRLKPDLVAPGERIQSSLPDNDWGELDGTSMAAPHVSGAAAMLMARYTEFIGQPHRIKNILCESATDLNRERSFQGYGMLDVLRAFQKI
jgi:subtilisin family serine protease